MRNLVIGSVPYLNGKPLVAQLEAGVPGVEVREAVPSALAGMLKRREVDAALVSSAVALADPSLCLVMAGAVISDGPVRSIRLMSRVPLDRIRVLALDASSRTSTVLCQILLRKRYGIRPAIVTLPPDLPSMLVKADAALMIGDPAMRAAQAIEQGEYPFVAEDVDLGALWKQEMGLPFVYAGWAAACDGPLDDLLGVLHQAAAWGIQRLPQIADDQAGPVGLPKDVCRRYFEENVYYDFGARERAGLARFQQEAVAMGLLPERPVPLRCFDGNE